VANKAKVYLQKYSQFVIDYAIEWEKVVTTRVGRGLKTAEEQRLELDHYQRKVEALRQTANATMVKGKQVDQKSADKLIRNEEKLGKIRDTYGKFTISLCMLIDEVTNRSWRDLHPLLVKIAQFEVTLSGDEAKALSTLNEVVNELKRVAATHGIKPQARLKDLDSMDPSTLSTRASGSGPLTIEAGLGGFSLANSNDVWSPAKGLSDAPLFPPGSVGPQGMGGFPMSVGASSDAYSIDGGSLHSGLGTSSAYGAPSTLDMLSITASAAPPPTVDMLTAAFGPSPGRTLSFNSAAMVPAPSPGHFQVRTQSTGSFDSTFSGVSGASAPPPAAPPPLPPQTPSQFGTAGAANMNPFGGIEQPTFGSPSPSFGAANLFGGSAPSPGNFGRPPPPPPAASPYSGGGAPPASPFSAALGPPPTYGQASPAYNQGFGQTPPPQQPPPPQGGFGQSPPPPPPPQGGFGQYGGASPGPYGRQQQGYNPF